MYFLNSNSLKRQQEPKKLRTLLTASFAASVVFHGVLFIFIPRWFSQKQLEKVEEPIELILLDKPKPIESKVVPKPAPPKPEPTPPPKVKTPKPEPPKPEPTPPPKVETPKPEPTLPPKVETPKPEPPKPEPPKPEPTPPPKVETPEPEKVLTTPDTTSSNAAPAPPVKASPTSNNEAIEKINTEETVAINSPPPEIAEPITDPAGISCVANCQPEYPSALDGDEGSAGVRLSIAPDGKVRGAELTNPHSNSMLNRQALLAARQMQFSEIDNEAGALVVVRINFTVEGSEFDDVARERQEKLEEERKAKLEEERQQKLEAQKQEQERRRSQLEQQRREEIQQQEAESPPATDSTDDLTEEELEAERIRKFRERLENYE